MRFASVQLDTPFGLSGWCQGTADVDTEDFDQTDFSDVNTADSNYMLEPWCTGMDMSCFRVAGRGLRKCIVRFGTPSSYLRHMAYADDLQVKRLLFHLVLRGVSTVTVVPFLMNAVLPASPDPAETETHVRAVETMLRLAHAVKTTEVMAAGGQYPRLGGPDEHRGFVEYVLGLRPVHLWLPSTLLPTPHGTLKPLTTRRTLPKNDRYLRHIQPILEPATRFCRMVAASTILKDELTRRPCIRELSLAGAGSGRAVAAMLVPP